jgi:CDP-diacylglycerol pyrophosphatase
VMEIAFNHLQRTSTTVETILSYGFLLLIRAEHYQNKQQREKIQDFACKIIKQ